MKPFIMYPDGIKSIEEVDKEFKVYRENTDYFKTEDGVEFVPALIKLAMPESESEANQDLALQSLQPPPSKVQLMRPTPWNQKDTQLHRHPMTRQTTPKHDYSTT